MDKIQKRPIEELVAGEAFRDGMVARADAMDGIYPLWHGWVIMEAFLARIDWARAQGGASNKEGGKS